MRLMSLLHALVMGLATTPALAIDLPPHASTPSAAGKASMVRPTPPAAQHPAQGACPKQAIDPAKLSPALDLQTDEQLDQAWVCTDQAGEHVVTVSRVRSPGQRGTEVLFTQRSRQAKGWKKDWQARDFLIAPTEHGSETRNRVVLNDVDHDGHLEAYIAYVLPGPSQSVDEGKLLVFFNGRKYAIRGAIPRSPDDFGSRQIGSAFYALPAAVQAQALSLWDQLSKPQGLQPVKSARP
jgi:hypothetical protein